MPDLVRRTDWSATPLGPIASWPTALRALVATMMCSPHPMLLFWGEELVQIYNDAFLPSFGRSKHPAALGQNARECWEEVWHLVGDQIEAAMRDGTPTWQADASVPIFRNGRIEDAYWTYGYSPARDDRGQIAGTLVVCTETTSSVLARRRLSVLQTISEAVGSADAGAETVLARALEVLAVPSDETPFVAIVDAKEGNVVDGVNLGEPLRAQLEAAFAADPPQSSVTLTLEPGEIVPRWPEPITAARVVELDRGRHMVFGLSPRLPFDDAYRDFLHRVVGQVASALQRGRLVDARAAALAERRNLMMQAPVAMAMMTGPELVFDVANPVYEAMVGREVIGKPFFDAFPEVRDTELAAILLRVYRDGTPFVAEEMPIGFDRAGTGTHQEMVYKFNVEPLRNELGDVYGMMVVAVDITATVHARRQIQAAHDDRHALVAELEGANRAKDEFLAVLGHELRNPLAPIVTALDLLRIRGATSREHEVIARQVAHVLRLVDDLLDVARISRGKLQLKLEDTDVADVIRRAIEMVEPLLQMHHHQLELELPDEPLTWRVDPARMQQVFANLLTNAARYTPPEGHIAVVVRRDGDDVVVSIVDDGQGIEPDLLDTLFDLFVQGSQGSDRRTGGLGLGLTLVRSLTELHGGSVGASSAGRDRGSEFVVRLPLSHGDTPIPTRVSVAPPPHRRRVLLVDDNVDAVEMLADALRSRSTEVRVAHDAPGAMALFGAFRPRVAVLDIGLPLVDGYELAEMIRAADGGAACRLVALTGYGREHDRRRSEEVGFDAHLVKPVSLADLLETLALVDPPDHDGPTESERDE